MMEPMTGDDIYELMWSGDYPDLQDFIEQAVNSHNLLLHMVIHAERIALKQKERIADLAEVCGDAAKVCQRAQVYGAIDDGEIHNLACGLTGCEIPAPGAERSN